MSRTSCLRTSCLRTFCLLGFLASFLLAAPPAVAAQNEARDAFTRGQAAYDRGDYDQAIAEWQRSFELSQKLSLLYNIALAYERVGKLVEAVLALERFVGGTQPDDPYLDRGRARLGEIKERLGQTGLVISCNEEGATILIDDQDRGRTPRPDRIALSPGAHRVIVRKPGFADFRSDVALAGGQELRLEATLAPAASVQPLPASGASDIEAQLAPSEPSGRQSSVLGPVLVIGGSALAVTGLVIGAVAMGAATDAENEMDADGARTLALVADISMGLGIAAAAVGTYFWFFTDREPATASAGVSTLGVGVVPGGALLSARGSF